MGILMGNSPTDKSKEFEESGMTLITYPESDRYLKKAQEKKKEDIISRNTILIEKKYFLPETECSKLIEFYNSNIDKSFSFRDTFPLDVYPPVAEDILNEFKTYDENILLDACQIVKWPAGSFMEPHIDKPGDVFAAIVYLNDDYNGGETCFEDIKIIPETGKLVIFSSTELLHWVNTIKKANRYTLSLWFSENVK